jgi:succinoglycan biosynthesis protein ExoL
MLLPVQSQARYWKLIGAFQDSGCPVEVFAFERDYYEGQASRREWTSLGPVPHGRYLARMPALLGAVRRIRAFLRDGDIVYCFGLDMLGVAWAATRVTRKRMTLAIEYGDIREIMMGDSLASRLSRALERFLLSRTDLVVTVSQDFVDGYFLGVQCLDRTRFAVIENRVAPWSLPPRPEPTRRDPASPITVGYFGVIRCTRSWEALRRAVRMAQGRVRVVVRGIPLGLPDFERQIAEEPNMSYGGPYVSPDDLPAMYAGVDIVWVAFAHGESNMRWTRANRYFEAGYFGKPVFAQDGTVDGNEVVQTGGGVVVDLADIDATAERIAGLTDEELDRAGAAMRAQPVERFILTDEYARVRDELERRR